MDTNAPSHSSGKTSLTATRRDRPVDDRGGDRSDDPAVSRAGIFCGFNFASENLAASPSTPGADGPSLSPEATEDFCAFANREAVRLVAYEQNFSLNLVPEPVEENSNIIPFPLEEIRPWHRIDRLFDGQDLADPPSDYAHSQSVAHTWQVIDGSGE